MGVAWLEMKFTTGVTHLAASIVKLHSALSLCNFTILAIMNGLMYMYWLHLSLPLMLCSYYHNIHIACFFAICSCFKIRKNFNIHVIKVWKLFVNSVPALRRTNSSVWAFPCHCNFLYPGSSHWRKTGTSLFAGMKNFDRLTMEWSNKMEHLLLLREERNRPSLLFRRWECFWVDFLWTCCSIALGLGGKVLLYVD